MSETAQNVVDSAVAQEAFLADVPANTSTITTNTSSTAATGLADSRFYTEDDLKKVREQEKSKLYPQIDSLKEELASFRKKDEERAAEAERLRIEAEAVAKKQLEAEMDFLNYIFELLK